MAVTARLETISEKKLVGKRLRMSFDNYKVSELWKSFMPNRKEISNKVTNNLVSISVYSPNHFEDFKNTNEFEKWAAVEVTAFENIPPEMEPIVLSAGLYAVFDYKGVNTDYSIYEYIFGSWLPNSAYLLDNRPHFEILGEKYKNDDPNSEEEIWIPIKAK